MSKKFLVVDSSDSYHTYATVYDGEDELLKSIQHSDVEDLEVYEIARKVKIKKQIAMIFDEAKSGRTT